MYNNIQNFQEIQTIAIIGAECTGKTTLTKKLATIHHTFYSLEYTRVFVEQFQRLPQIDDISWIAKNQLFLQKKAINQTLQNNYKLMPVFFDTDLLINWVLAEHYLGDNAFTQDCQDLFWQNLPNKYIFLLPTISWKEDGIQRESNEIRHLLHEKIRLKLIKLQQEAQQKKLIFPQIHYISERELEKRIFLIQHCLQSCN